MSATDRLHDFSLWLAHSPLNAAVTAQGWFVPEIQIVHIVAIAAVVIAALHTVLRVFGLIETELPVAEVARGGLRVILVAVGVLALTGFLLIASEPGRALFRWVFWVKLALIALALGVTASLARGEGTRARIAGGVSLVLWAGVILAGRWIAYADAWTGAAN